MLGLVLLYIGAVLVINGLTGLGRVTTRESAVLNVFVGAISVACCAATANPEDPRSVRESAFGLLFGLTYLWVAWNQLTGADGRGLGWFSGFVALTAAAIAADLIFAPQQKGPLWWALCWALWAALWAGHFLTGALRRDRLKLPVAWASVAQGVVTAWLPGYLLLTGRLAAP